MGNSASLIEKLIVLAIICAPYLLAGWGVLWLLRRIFGRRHG